MRFEAHFSAGYDLDAGGQNWSRPCPQARFSAYE
jgi:hypothetical protein